MTKPLEHKEEDKEGPVDKAAGEANGLERDALFRKEVAPNLSMNAWIMQRPLRLT